MAGEGNFTQATALLERSLGEEQSMTQWIDGSLPMVTRRYATLYAEHGSNEAKV